MGTNRFVGAALATVVMAVVAAGACERMTPVAPTHGARAPALRAALTPLADGQAMGKFQVCSDGSAATYTFSAQNYPDVATGQMTGSVTVAAGDCAVLYTTDVHGLATVNAVTVTMTNPTTPDMLLTSIVGHGLFWHCDVNGCTTDDTPTTFTNTTSITYNVNGDIGALAYFDFTPAPPPPCPPTAITSNFNGTPIASGRWIWFNAIVKVTGLGGASGIVHAQGSSIAFSAGGTSYTLPVPDATITFSPAATQATTSFNTVTGAWETTVPAGYPGNVFLGGLAFQLPVAFPGGINPVTWATQLSSNVAGVTYQWKWAAAVYTTFAPTSDAIGAKPIDGGTMNPYANSDHAGTPESFKAYVIGGARGGGGSNWTGSYSGTARSEVCTR